MYTKMENFSAERSKKSAWFIRAKKLLYKLAESGGAFGDSKWQKLLNLARQTPFSTAFELVFKVLAVRKCKGVFASYEVEMNHAKKSV